MRRNALAVLTAVLVGGAVYASAIKVWGSGEVITATDLNAALAHLHANVIGHGPRIVNADITSTAGIAHSKLASPALLPKAWAYSAPCAGGGVAGTVDCSFSGSGITAIKNNGTDGQYRVNLEYSPPTANLGTVVSSNTATVFCIADSTTFTATSGDANGTNFVVKCISDAGTPTDAAFSFTLLTNG